MNFVVTSASSVNYLTLSFEYRLHNRYSRFLDHFVRIVSSKMYCRPAYTSDLHGLRDGGGEKSHNLSVILQIQNEAITYSHRRLSQLPTCNLQNTRVIRAPRRPYITRHGWIGSTFVLSRFTTSCGYKRLVGFNIPWKILLLKKSVMSKLDF